jgi:hypothetical protein
MSSVAVVGSRGFTDYPLLKRRLDDEIARWEIARIVSGGAQGADRLAARYARETGLELLELKPDWKRGRGAGKIRNSDIVRRADWLIAFWDGESPGTLDTIQKARRVGKDVDVVLYGT